MNENPVTDGEKKSRRIDDHTVRREHALGRNDERLKPAINAFLFGLVPDSTTVRELDELAHQVMTLILNKWDAKKWL